MNAAERGIYRELLDECWLEGSLPNDMDELADIARVSPAEMTDAWPVLKPCFSERPDGRYVNDKIARVHLAQLEVLARRRDSGRKGGLSTQAKLKQALSTPKAREREIEISLNSRAGTLVATPPLLRDLHGLPTIPDVNAEVAEPMTDAQKQEWRAALGGSPRAVSPPTGT